jgi:hypothetical protein
VKLWANPVDQSSLAVLFGRFPRTGGGMVSACATLREMTISALLQAAAATEREQRLAAAASGCAGGVPVLPDKLAALEAAAAIFSEQGVPYALLGGLAVGIRSGVPRATIDVDFAVATRVDRAWLRERLSERAFSTIGTFAHSDNFRHSSGEPVQLAYDPHSIR